MGLYSCVSSSGVLVMRVIDAIRSGYLQNEQYESPSFREIQKIQDFLESCFAHECEDISILKIITELAASNKVSFDTVRLKILEIVHVIGDLSELNKQVQIHKLSLDDFLKSAISIANDPSVSIRFKNIDCKLAESYFDGFFEALTERNLFINEMIILYWSYLPYELRQAISIIVNYEIKFKENKHQGYTSGSVSAYYDSVDLVESSYSHTFNKNLNGFSWKLTKLLISNKTDNVLNTDIHRKAEYKSKMPKGYTLEDMLNSFSTDCRHEEINWGRPVGKEIW